MSHANARLTPHGRWLLVQRVRVHGRPVAHVARELGVSRQCAHRWVARFDAQGMAGLVDRSSRPHRSPRATSGEQVAVVLAERARARCGPDELARTTGVPARTISRLLRRAGVPYLCQSRWHRRCCRRLAYRGRRARGPADGGWSRGPGLVAGCSTTVRGARRRLRVPRTTVPRVSRRPGGDQHTGGGQR